MKRLVLGAVGLVGMIASAHATIVNGTFSGTLLPNGPLPGPAITGTFSYDTSLLGIPQSPGVYYDPQPDAISITETFGGMTVSYLDDAIDLTIQYVSSLNSYLIAFYVAESTAPYNGSAIAMYAPPADFVSSDPTPLTNFDLTSSPPESVAFYDSEDLVFSFNNVEVSVAEPSTLAILGGCLIGLLGLRQRKQPVLQSNGRRIDPPELSSALDDHRSRTATLHVPS
jgi:hypothetical protein